MAAGSVSRLGIGLAALGRPAYLTSGRDGLTDRSVAGLRARTVEVLDAAYDAGIRWVDAARSYGRAEEFLAHWLDLRRPSDVTVSSKWGYAYVGGWRRDADVHEEKSHSLERFREQWARTAALLGSVALYQVHSLTLDSPLWDDRALLDALAGLAADGVRVGFSTSGSGQAAVVRRGLALRVAGMPVFSAVQSTWNVLEPSVGPSLAEAASQGAHVLVKETLANGRLAECDGSAVAAVLAQPWAGTVLLGPVDVAQLTSNLAALSAAPAPVTPEDPEEYWAARSARPWS